MVVGLQNFAKKELIGKLGMECKSTVGHHGQDNKLPVLFSDTVFQ